MRLGEGQHASTKNLPTFGQKQVYTFVKRTGEMTERDWKIHVHVIAVGACQVCLWWMQTRIL